MSHRPGQLAACSSITDLRITVIYCDERKILLSLPSPFKESSTERTLGERDGASSVGFTPLVALLPVPHQGRFPHLRLELVDVLSSADSLLWPRPGDAEVQHAVGVSAASLTLLFLS